MLKVMCKILLFIFSLPLVVLIVPFGMMSYCEKKITSYEFFFSFGAHLVALFPGFIGDHVRRVYYMLTLDYYHPSAVISYGSFFSKRGARIKADAGIGAYCVIGLVDIKKNVRIASRVSITSGLNQHGNSSNITNGVEGNGENRQITIGEKTWIGEGAIVSASVGNNCIVGVGAVVTNDIPDNNMAMGNPARLLPTANKTI